MSAKQTVQNILDHPLFNQIAKILALLTLFTIAGTIWVSFENEKKFNEIWLVRDEGWNKDLNTLLTAANNKLDEQGEELAILRLEMSLLRNENHVLSRQVIQMKAEFAKDLGRHLANHDYIERWFNDHFRVHPDLREKHNE